MKKDYKKWHSLKTEVNANPPLRRFHEREIWWCSLGENVGFEEDGKNELFERPILVIRKFNKELFMGVPLTSKHKPGNKYYIPVQVGGVKRSVITSQVRALSSRRLIRKIDRHGKKEFMRIVQEVTLVLQKTISADESAESPVPSGNLYPNSSKHKPNSQEDV